MKIKVKIKKKARRRKVLDERGGRGGGGRGPNPPCAPIGPQLRWGPTYNSKKESKTLK